MGVVYKARQRGLNRLVALKMIRGGSQARGDHVARFRVEAEAVAHVRHANILQIYDIGEAEGMPFVALELLDGGGLDERLAGNPQPGRAAAELMITLARAVHVAHVAGIIHRDLKPTNILYTSDGIPKITDFGLAKRIDSDAEHTQSGQIMGSPSYMAPEQARGDARKVGPAADVYALGAILYEMLTGRPPFKGETPIDTVRQVVETDPVAPSQLVPKVPRDLETICLKCLHKDPTRRYASADDLADDLTRYLRGEPIRARRSTILERGVKWARRRPVAATGWAAAILLVFGGILAAFAWERSARIEAERSARWAQGRQDLASQLDHKARQASTRDELVDTRSALFNLRDEVQDKPGLDGLRSRVDESLKVVEGRIAEFESREANLSREREEQDRLRRFPKLLSEALFHDTQFTGLDLSTNKEATRRAARAALDLFAAPGSGDSWVLRPLLAKSQAERDEVVEGCYELLLVLAEAEIAPDQGMRRLDQAARLRPPTKAFHLRKAACLARAGAGPAAQKERGVAERLKATTAFDHFLVGQERYKRQDYRGALRDFQAALELRPGHFWAQCLRAISALQLNRPVEAKSSLDSCLRQEPEFAWLYVLRGFASSRVAGVFLEQAGRATSSREFLVQWREQLDAAEADYGRAMGLLDRNPNDDLRYAVLVNRGLLGLDRKELGAAAGYLQTAIRLNGREMEAYAGLAEVYQRQGKPDEAVEQYDRAIALRPDWPPLYRGRANVARSRPDLTPVRRSRALKDLERAIQLEKPGNPVMAQDHVNRARLLADGRREAEALAACDEAFKVFPDYPPAHELRIRLLLGLNRYDDVIRSCDPLIAQKRATAFIYELRGLAREATNDLAGAIEDFTGAMALGGDRARFLKQRGWLYILADAPQFALHDFQAVIRLDPSHGDAYTGKGFARLRQGEHRQGVADAEKGLSVGEPTPRVLYTAARVYAHASLVAAAEVRKRGQETVVQVNRYQDRAVALLRRALKLMPEEQRAKLWREAIPADPALRTLRRRLASPDLAEIVPGR
jgi:tetratricopeptide (TPR) repeat protein